MIFSKQGLYLSLSNPSLYQTKCAFLNKLQETNIRERSLAWLPQMKHIKLYAHFSTNLWTKKTNITAWLGVLTANEAGVFENLFLLLFLTAQVCECVDDDAEYQIENDNDDNEEEQKVVDDTCKKQRLL